jgi:hypothetical protein
MNNLAQEITTLLVRELDAFKREVELFPDDEVLWQTAPGVSNSAGNLAVHVAGGLQYLVGTVLGQTGYVRNRDLEFARRTGTRAEVIAELDRTIAVVRDVLARLPESTLLAPYPEPVLGLSFGTRIGLLHLCAHAAFHLGQAGYLRRVLTGESAQSSAPLPLMPLVGGQDR